MVDESDLTIKMENFWEERRTLDIMDYGVFTLFSTIHLLSSGQSRRRFVNILVVHDNFDGGKKKAEAHLTDNYD